MPPFRLEAPERPPTHSRKPQIIYTKNMYSEGVKVRQWQEVLEHKPVDVDPFCPGKINHFLSHYRRLGIKDESSFSTTTRDMLQQIFIKDKMIPEKLMNNYYVYNDDAECLATYPNNNYCSPVCADEFLTTMQHSYPVPQPYVMQRLAFPKIPYMQNQKYHHELPHLSSKKFYGDDFEHVTCQLRKHKGFRWISYNPMTGDYNTHK